jgi:hypothetical protein
LRNNKIQKTLRRDVQKAYNQQIRETGFNHLLWIPKKTAKKKTKQMSVGTDGDGVSWQSYSYHHIYYFGVSEPTSENGEKRRCFLHVWNFVLGDKKLNIKMKK